MAHPNTDNTSERHEYYGGTTYEVPKRVRWIFLSATWIDLGYKALGLALAALVPISAFSGIQGLMIARDWVGLAAGFGWLLSKTLYWANQRRAHRVRSTNALFIHRAIVQGGRPTYCLYLRPFLTSKRLVVANSRFHRKFWPSMDRFFGPRMDLENVLAVALEAHQHPLIAIGETGFQMGAAKVISRDSEWKEVFVALASAAAAIVMVPLPRPSTLWEIEYLLAHPELLEKTLFIMPKRLRLGVTEKLEPYWAEMSQWMSSRGVVFPALRPGGAFFVLRNGGRVLRQVEGGGFDVDYIGQIVKALLSRRHLQGSIARLSEAEIADFWSLIESLVHVSPYTLQIEARPMMLHEAIQLVDCPTSMAEMASLGIIVVHRSQRGSQAWDEIHLNPTLLDWTYLEDWAEGRRDMLTSKGCIVEATVERLASAESALRDLPRERDLPSSLSYVLSMEPRVMPSPRLLRPEERVTLGSIEAHQLSKGSHNARSEICGHPN